MTCTGFDGTLLETVSTRLLLAPKNVPALTPRKNTKDGRSLHGLWDPRRQAKTPLGERKLISCSVNQRLPPVAMSAVTALSCMQGELSKQEAAALEALKDSRARKLAVLLSENKLQALQQKKAVEEALAQASET